MMFSKLLESHWAQLHTAAMLITVSSQALQLVSAMQPAPRAEFADGLQRAVSTVCQQIDEMTSAVFSARCAVLGVISSFLVIAGHHVHE
jgi:hypothetical protein